MSKVDEIFKKEQLEKEDLLELIYTEEKEEIEKIYKKAYEVKLKNVGNKVYYRGIIEFSNLCTKNCYYCGIRKGNKNVERFSMTEEEILKSAEWAYINNYGSIVLQSGERKDEEYVNFVKNILNGIKKIGDGVLGVTLSLGEQNEEIYRTWFEEGAHRYLLRIETSNKSLYNKIHPEDHSFEERLNCIKLLKKIGYQTGTGVMIGLPGQTKEDLINDILFFKEYDIDMIGMGPYIVHKDTPLGQNYLDEDTEEDKIKRFELGLKMIALTRLFLKDVNIASTTALQALNPIGRELGLKAGANIIMPVITDITHRKKYQLYDNKPCMDENADECKQCLENRIKSIGDVLIYGEWGDSPHYKHIKNK